MPLQRNKRKHKRYKVSIAHTHRARNLYTQEQRISRRVAVRCMYPNSSTCTQSISRASDILTRICCVGIWCASACENIVSCFLHFVSGCHVETVAVAAAFDSRLVKQELSAGVQHQHDHFGTALCNAGIVSERVKVRGGQ